MKALFNQSECSLQISMSVMTSRVARMRIARSWLPASVARVTKVTKETGSSANVSNTTGIFSSKILISTLTIRNSVSRFTGHDLN